LNATEVGRTGANPHCGLRKGLCVLFRRRRAVQRRVAVHAVAGTILVHEVHVGIRRDLPPDPLLADIPVLAVDAALDYRLSADKFDELHAAHRSTRDKREADRVKAVVLLATGWTAEDVAEVDPNTVRNHFKRYRQGGIEALHRIGTGVGGSACMLDAEQMASLDARVQENVYLSAKAFGRWVEETFAAKQLHAHFFSDWFDFCFRRSCA
jgi:hypothetical protein